MRSRILPVRPTSPRLILLLLNDCPLLFAELENLPDVVNDLDVDISADPKAAAAYANDQRNIRKVKEHTQKLQVNVIHPLREGKRLLVLDIDYSESPVDYVHTCASNLMRQAFDFSYFGYQAIDFRSTPASGMCKTPFTRVSGSRIPLL